MFDWLRRLFHFNKQHRKGEAYSNIPKADDLISGTEKETDTRGKWESKSDLSRQRVSLFEVSPDPEEAIEILLRELEDDDPAVRLDAARLLAVCPSSFKQLASLYEDYEYSNPRKACVIGRVFGRKAAAGRTDDIISAIPIREASYGISLAFVPAQCPYCGFLNVGIPVRPRGIYIGMYTSEEAPEDLEAEERFSVPIQCDNCSKEFFKVWDHDPR